MGIQKVPENESLEPVPGSPASDIPLEQVEKTSRKIETLRSQQLLLENCLDKLHSEGRAAFSYIQNSLSQEALLQESPMTWDEEAYADFITTALERVKMEIDGEQASHHVKHGFEPELKEGKKGRPDEDQMDVSSEREGAKWSAWDEERLGRLRNIEASLVHFLRNPEPFQSRLQEKALETFAEEIGFPDPDRSHYSVSTLLDYTRSKIQKMLKNKPTHATPSELPSVSLGTKRDLKMTQTSEAKPRLESEREEALQSSSAFEAQATLQRALDWTHTELDRLQECKKRLLDLSENNASTLDEIASELGLFPPQKHEPSLDRNTLLLRIRMQSQKLLLSLNKAYKSAMDQALLCRDLSTMDTIREKFSPEIDALEIP